MALFATTLFLSASYCLWVLSMLMLRFRATFTKAVINFMAGKDDNVEIHTRRYGNNDSMRVQTGMEQKCRILK